MTDTLSSIFIIGYMHSGTTLLKNILGNHPDVFSGRGESKIFEFLPEISASYQGSESDEDLKRFMETVSNVLWNGYRIGPEGAGRENPFLEALELDELVARVRGRKPEDVIKPIAGRMTLLSQKKHWLEKTPTHVFYVDKIKKAIPEAKFVEIVRDPRSVLASKKTRRQTVFTHRVPVHQQEFKNLERAYDPVWDLLSWKSAVSAGEKAGAKYPQSIVRMRYEDLVLNPEKVVREVCAAIGIEFFPEMLKVETDNSAYEMAGYEGAGIFSASVDRWTEVLDPSELLVIDMLAKKELASLGYRESLPKLVSFVPVIKIGVGSAKNFLTRMYSRYRMGGMKFLKKVISGYASRLGILLGIKDKA